MSAVNPQECYHYLVLLFSGPAQRMCGFVCDISSTSGRNQSQVYAQFLLRDLQLQGHLLLKLPCYHGCVCTEAPHPLVQELVCCSHQDTTAPLFFHHNLCSYPGLSLSAL